jgi:predicted nucleotide-binding protein
MATRRTPPAQPKQAKLTRDQMSKGVARIEKIIAEVEAFDPTMLTKRWSAEQKALESTIEGALASVFGHGTVEYNRYRRAASLDHGAVSMNTPTWVSARGGYGERSDEARLAQQYVAEGKNETIQLLRQAVRWLRDEISDSAEEVAPVAADERPIPVLTRKVFIVHGHDDGVREAVARYVERIGFEAVILREQANQGRTIIEKIEAHSEVGFAVVLLTPDDTGCKAGEIARPRPRQNVLMELGYFIGRLGRANVCALATSGDMELPTDFAGVVWEPFDAAGGWKQSLARELDAAGFEIDWNKVMRP